MKSNRLDCRPEFIDALDLTLRIGNAWADPLPRIVAPFVEKTKADIARLIPTLQVPIGETWSCYRGGEIHCGTCGTCVERRQALFLAQVADPTEYACTWEQSCAAGDLDPKTGRE